MKLLHVFSVIVTPQSFFDGQFKMMVDAGYDIHIVMSPCDQGEEFAKKNGIQYYPLEISRNISLKNDIKTILALKKYIKKEKFDAVFGHTPKGALISMLAAKLCGIKKRIYYRHGVVYTTAQGIKRFILKLEEQFVSALATDIINVSPSLSELAISDKLNSERKQYVIGKGTCGGIDALQQFNPEKKDQQEVAEMRKTLGLGDALVFGFCGRICNDKGIPELLEAFQQFKAKHQEIITKLLLVGELDSRDSITEKYGKIIENDKDIIVTGWIDNNQVQDYYECMDVFVFPSHREGFGMCVIEASALEKPVLVSKVHGCVNTIVENQTGLYIPLNAEGICTKMEAMLDAKLRFSLGKNGRKWVVENFDHTIIWPKVIELYRTIL